MQTLLNTTSLPVSPASSPVIAPKAKRNGKAKPVAAPVAKLSLRAEANAKHDAAGFTGNRYAGLSKPRNAGQTGNLDLRSSKATARTIAQLTERMRALLSELHAKHGTKPMPIVGIDRGAAAIFVNSGLLNGYSGDMRGNVTLSAKALAYVKPVSAKAAAPAKPADAPKA